MWPNAGFQQHCIPIGTLSLLKVGRCVATLYISSSGPHFQLRSPWVCLGHAQLTQGHCTTSATRRIHGPCLGPWGDLESQPLWQNGLPYLLHTWTIFTAAGVHTRAQLILSGPLLPAGAQVRSKDLLPGVCPGAGCLHLTQGQPLFIPLLHPDLPNSDSTSSSHRSCTTCELWEEGFAT